MRSSLVKTGTAHNVRIRITADAGKRAPSISTQEQIHHIKGGAMNEELRAAQPKQRLVFCTDCGQQYWAEERCPSCDARPKPQSDRLGITRFLMEDEYSIQY